MAQFLGFMPKGFRGENHPGTGYLCFSLFGTHLDIIWIGHFQAEFYLKRGRRRMSTRAGR